MFKANHVRGLEWIGDVNYVLEYMGLKLGSMLTHPWYAETRLDDVISWYCTWDVSGTVTDSEYDLETFIEWAYYYDGKL